MFGEFKFGPLFVRLCYELGLESLAAATLTDKVKCFTIITDERFYAFIRAALNLVPISPACLNRIWGDFSMTQPPLTSP